MRIQPWDVALRDGRSITVRPLTVRQRIAITNEMADERVQDAQRDAKTAGMLKDEILASVRAARKEALIASTLILDCYTIRGALRVVNASCEHGDELAEWLEPKAFTELALCLLGFGDDEEGKPVSAEGKAVAP